MLSIETLPKAIHGITKGRGVVQLNGLQHRNERQAVAMPTETNVVKRAAEFCSSASFKRVFDLFARSVV